MASTVEDSLGDLSRPLALHSTFRRAPVAERSRSSNPHIDAKEDTGDAAESPRGLGNFSSIYRMLGVSDTTKNTSSPKNDASVTDDGEPARTILPTKTDYASDGAAYSRLSNNKSKGVQFQAETSNDEQGATDTFSEGSVEPDTPTLTKSQRKRKNKKQKKAQQSAQVSALVDEVSEGRLHVSESEAGKIKNHRPAKKASVHSIPQTPEPRYNLRSQKSPGDAIAATEEGLKGAVDIAKQRVAAAKNAANTANTTNQPPAPKRGDPSTYVPPGNFGRPPPEQADRGYPSGPYAPIFFTPSSVMPPTHPAAIKAANHPMVGQPNHHTSNHQFANDSNNTLNHDPLLIRKGIDRHYALLMKTIQDFPEDMRTLVAPANLTTHNNHPEGIHAFVDASNIFIGFMDQLRKARGLSRGAPLPGSGISFDSFALLLERRRPMAKRIIVGSAPRIPAHDRAEAVGYECSVLEKVYKEKELSERQVHFKEMDMLNAAKRSKAPPINNVATLRGMNGSDSQTRTPQYAPAAYVEQGVDEILHLKMLESILDSPPGTMVLATGDAALAEYSGGFMEQLERALKKGWKVELVCWSANVSSAYSMRAWTSAWGDRFKVIYLDDYVELLLDV